MRPTVKITTFPDVTDSGTVPVKMRVTFQRKVRYFHLSRYVLPDFWDKQAGRFRRGHTDWKEENEVLAAYEHRALSAIRGFELDGAQFTFEKFEALVFGDRNRSLLSVPDFIRQIQKELEEAGSVGNADIYRHCANAVTAFNPKTVFSDIDTPWLTGFEKWMRIKRRTGGGGMSLVMRTLRASCSRAVKAGVMPKAFRPFEDYSISHLKGDRIKKALPIEHIRAFAEAKIPPHLEFSRDLFMLSFYLRGMNMADLAELKKDNVIDGRIVYRRKKTGGLFSIPITPQAEEILARYSNCDTHYLLPIFLWAVHVTPRQKIYRVKRVTREVNTAIREVAMIAGLSTENFTFYSGRHSYASALDKKGVPRAIISQALGHKSLQTTEGYLKAFESEDIDRADELLF